MSRWARRQPFELLLALAAIWLAAQVKTGSGILGTLALIGAIALLWPAPPDIGAERRRNRLLVGLALVSATFALSGYLPEFLTTSKVRVWNVYHYYVGAKYFPELGYTDLYDATLSADRESANYWRPISRVRNLHTYDLEDKRSRIRAYLSSPGETPRDRFTEERWQSFSSDVEALSGQLPPRRWRGIFIDRGYNGTPVWTVLGSSLAHLVPADWKLGLKLVCSLDLWMLTATFALIWRTFGLRSAALVLLLLTLTPVNRGRFVGGFLQYDWFCAFAAGVCFYRRRRLGLAAGAMAYAAVTRIFPLLFVVAGALPMLERWWRTGRRPARQIRFLTAFAGWCALGFVLSLANGRGLDGWSEFATGISLHREHHLFGEARVGLQRVFTHDLEELREKPKSQGLTIDRRSVYQRQRPLFFLAAAALLGFFLLVVRGQRTWNAQLLGLIPIFALLVTSRYYGSYLALLPLLGGRRGPPALRSRWLTAGQLLVFVGFYAVESRGVDPRTAYGVLNVLLVVFFVVVLGLCLRRDSR